MIRRNSFRAHCYTRDMDVICESCWPAYHEGHRELPPEWEPDVDMGNDAPDGGNDGADGGVPVVADNDDEHNSWWNGRPPVICSLP